MNPYLYSLGSHRDAVAIEATRNAPPWMIERINRTRRAEGRSALPWPERRSEPEGSRHVVIVGACCPGRSTPVKAAYDGLLLPEVIDPRAFDRSLRMIRKGDAVVALEAGHRGLEMASTRWGTLDLMTCERSGLLLVARVRASKMNAGMLAHAMAGKLGLSVSMVPRRIEIVMRGGRRVRVIREADLHSIAALWQRDVHGRACYPAARALAAFECDTMAVRRAMRSIGVGAARAASKARGL